MVMRLAPLALLLLSCWSSTLYFNVSATTTFTLLTKVRDHDVMVTGADTRSSMSQSAPPSEAVARDKMLNTGVEDAQRRLGVSRGKGWWGKMKGIFKSGLPEPTPGNTALDPRGNIVRDILHPILLGQWFRGLRQREEILHKRARDSCRRR